MAIVTGILNETTRKGLDGVCFQHYNGQTIMRSKPLTYRDAKSPAQLAHRQKMKNLGYVYKRLSGFKWIDCGKAVLDNKTYSNAQAWQKINANRLVGDVDSGSGTFAYCIQNVILSQGFDVETGVILSDPDTIQFWASFIDLTPYLWMVMKVRIVKNDETIIPFDFLIDQQFVDNHYYNMPRSFFDDGHLKAFACQIVDNSENIVSNSKFSYL